MIPPVNQAEGGVKFSNVWLQNSRSMSVKMGSFQSNVGILSRPEDLLLEKRLTHFVSSSFVKGEVAISSSSKIWVKGSASVFKVG